MKIKINKESLKSSFTICFFTLLFNFVFWYFSFFIIWYWAIPNICTIVPIFKTHLESLSDEILPVAYNIVYSIGSVISIFPSTILAYRISKKRKKDFLSQTKGRISYVDGINYHFTKHGLSDLIFSSITIILPTLIYIIASKSPLIRFFPTAFYMLNSLGVIFGFLVTTLLTALAMFCGIFFSQKKWRAEYFINY